MPHPANLERSVTPSPALLKHTCSRFRSGCANTRCICYRLHHLLAIVQHLEPWTITTKTKTRGATSCNRGRPRLPKSIRYGAADLHLFSLGSNSVDTEMTGLDAQLATRTQHRQGFLGLRTKHQHTTHDLCSCSCRLMHHPALLLLAFAFDLSTAITGRSRASSTRSAALVGAALTAAIPRVGQPRRPGNS